MVTQEVELPVEPAPMREYEETLLKARSFFAALGTVP